MGCAPNRPREAQHGRRSLRPARHRAPHRDLARRQAGDRPCSRRARGTLPAAGDAAAELGAVRHRDGPHGGRPGRDRVDAPARAAADRGLAGMAPATLFEERRGSCDRCSASRREALRDLLRDAGIDWIDDPTQHQPGAMSARVCAQRLAACRSECPSGAALASRQNAARRPACRRQQLIDASASRVAPGLIRLAPDFADRAERPRRRPMHCASCWLAWAARATCPTRRGWRRLSQVCGRTGFRATLSRSVVEVRRDGIYLRRENRVAAGARCQPADGAIWDGRFRIEASTGAGKATVAPDPGAGEEASTAGTAAPARLIAAAGRTMPRLFAAESNSRIGPFWTARPILPPWRDFLPGFDLAPARALAGLLGADEPASPPLRQHNVTPA